MIGQKLQDFEEEVKGLGDVMTQVRLTVPMALYTPSLLHPHHPTGHHRHLQLCIHQNASYTSKDTLPVQSQRHLKGTHSRQCIMMCNHTMV